MTRGRFAVIVSAGENRDNDRMDVIEKKPGRSWFTWSLHAGAMFIACLIIYISFDAIFQGRVPASFRNVAVMAGEATGYFLLPLLLSWVVVTFSRRIGWLVWLVTVGFSTLR